MVGTAKEVAVLWLLDGLNASPSDDGPALETLIRAHYPQSSGRFTDKQMEKIEVAFRREAGRVKKMYAQYLASRGHNVDG